MRGNNKKKKKEKIANPERTGKTLSESRVLITPYDGRKKNARPLPESIESGSGEKGGGKRRIICTPQHEKERKSWRMVFDHHAVCHFGKRGNKRA